MDQIRVVVVADVGLLDIAVTVAVRIRAFVSQVAFVQPVVVNVEAVVYDVEVAARIGREMARGEVAAQALLGHEIAVLPVARLGEVRVVDALLDDRPGRQPGDPPPERRCCPRCEPTKL